jgi:hypothetical protein
MVGIGAGIASRKHRYDSNQRDRSEQFHLVKNRSFPLFRLVCGRNASYGVFPVTGHLTKGLPRRYWCVVPFPVRLWERVLITKKLATDLLQIMKRQLFLVSMMVASIVAALPMRAAEAQSSQQAVAVLSSTAGQQCHGVVRFTQEGESVKVVADLEGLNPGQKHAFHIHQFGDCSAPDGMSAGSHYNPEGHKHRQKCLCQRLKKPNHRSRRDRSC